MGVADTLYIPLTARIYVSRRFPEYFRDPKSLELESAIPGDSISKGSNEYSMIASVARYHNLDEMARAFASKNPACNIVNVGCGLETMFWRVGPDAPGARFFEVDLPEVIETRRRVLGESGRDTLIAGDAFDLSWADGIDAALPTLIVVSGVFQYFRNTDVLGFIADAKLKFADAELAFDATNTKGLEFANRYVRKTGNASALMHCAIDDPAAFARGGLRAHRGAPVLHGCAPHPQGQGEPLHQDRHGGHRPHRPRVHPAREALGEFRVE